MRHTPAQSPAPLRVTKAALSSLQLVVPVVGLFLAVMLVASISNGPDLVSELSGEREISDPRRALAAFRVALGLAIGATAAFWVIMLNLLRIIEAVQNSDPFIPACAAHLRAIGIALSGFVAAYLAAKAVVQSAVPSAHGIDWLAISPAVGAIFLIFVLAEVFKEGARMREELEATV